MKISLCIPCFNSEKTLGACLEGALHQSMPADEILVIDDGSTDMTAAIAGKYPVKIIKHAKNMGLAAARNTAIKNTDAEFIASLDSDCKPDKDWLKYLVGRINLSNVAGAGGRVVETGASSIFDIWRSVHMQQHWGERRKTNPPFLFGSNTLFRKAALISAGFYDDNYRNNFEDVDISRRLRKTGYNLVYEPQAAVGHLREDDLFSLLNNFWRWHFAFYVEEGFYKNPERFAFKIKDNIGLANRFLEEDLNNERYKLIYLDFLIALHHSLRDFDYFNFPGSQGQFNIAMHSKVSFWLSLLDLTFFYHFDCSKRNLSSLIQKEDTFPQNFLALGLILSIFMRMKFSDREFNKTLHRHLLFSVYKIRDDRLLDRFFNLSQLHQDWSGLIKKQQVNLNSGFLEVLLLNFKSCIESLASRFSGISKLIENSARETDQAMTVT
ncbi:MAG: glycosyltransferase family 2 protein [Candidatus Omnitrophota bacterium]